MSTMKMPASLPKGFQQIWSALRDAAERSRSRQVLAEKLGISTHTIQRILVDGDVPDLSRATNARVVRAWVGIITRIALSSGGEPREWVEKVGLPWDEVIRSVSEAAALKMRVRRPSGAAGMAGAVPATPVGPSLTPADVWPEHIRVGVAEQGAFAQSLASLGGSFLEVYTRRLLGSVNPSTRLRFQALYEREVISGLLDAEPGLNVGAGVIETVHRQYLGLGFLPVPGFELRLNAICLRPVGDAGDLPTWRDATSAGALFGDRSQRRLLVTAGGISQSYLAGQCGIPPEEMLVGSPLRPDEMARLFLEETRRYPKAKVVLVDVEDVCARVMESLERTEGLSGAYRVYSLAGAMESGPRYSLGLAFRARGHPWLKLLTAARDEELFGSSLRRTAELYASLLTASFLDRNPVGLPEPGAFFDICPDPDRPQGRVGLIRPRGLSGVVRLVDFKQATPEFREVFYRSLVLSLKGALVARLESEGTVEGRDAIESRASERAAAYAEHLLPVEWLRAVREALARSDSLGVAPPTPIVEGLAPVARLSSCQSCSVSLLEEQNRGVSGLYCRFCADEEGQLKPRGKVQNLIAHWFERWQEGMTHEEAMRRAGMFMQAMPAWSKN
jgi:hypothetical protein